jgi:exopolysaccharide biosynthesis polyprenyl glycosylphosphotransferase
VRPVRLRGELLVADLAGGAVAGAAAAFAAGLPIARLGLAALVVGLGWPAFAYLCGLYARADLQAWASGIDEAPRLAVAGLLISWPVFGLLFELRAPRPAIGALFAAGMTVAAVGIGRAAARVRLHSDLALRERVLIVGSGDVARQLVERMRHHHEFGLDPIGFVDDDAYRPAELDVPRLGPLDSLPALIGGDHADRVVIAFTRGSHEQLHHCIRVCRDAGIPISIVPRLFEFLDSVHAIEQIGGMPLLSIQPPSFPLVSRLCKRALDVVGAAAMLLVLSPLLLAIAIAIRLDSRGPVFFVQQRSGRAGRFFTLYKFRSMDLNSAVLVQETGAIFKARNDDRITRVGRLIRRFSLDEAPQLFNVLRGDMSLVGPRPLVQAEQAALVEAWQSRRGDLRPGLTGPWQVSGRSLIPFEDMIKLDYQYVAGWSLARDLRILLATLPAVISGRGAY